MHLSVCMFQCVIQRFSKEVVDLKNLYQILSSNPNVLQIKKFAPGSLGQAVKENHLIGSLSIKSLDKCSILLFNNNKMKISGGCRDVTMHTNNVQHEVHQQKIVPLLHSLELTMDHHIVSFMFNANIKRNIRINNYALFLEKIRKNFNIQEPKIFTSSKQRGRVCAVKIKSLRGGSIMLDHGGNIQCFAYNDLEYLNQELHKLSAYL